MWKELMTMPHVVFGVFGILFAVWVAVEAANSSEANQRRLKLASIGTTLFLWLSYLFGGWWYVVYYGATVITAINQSYWPDHGSGPILFSWRPKSIYSS